MPFARTWKHPNIKVIHHGITVYETYIDDMEDLGVREGFYTRDPQLAHYDGRDFSLRDFNIPTSVGDPADPSQHDAILRWLIDQGKLDRFPDPGLGLWDTWNIYVESTFGDANEILVESLVGWADAMERPVFRAYANVGIYPHGFVAIGIEHCNLLAFPRTGRAGYFSVAGAKLLRPDQIEELQTELDAVADSIRTAAFRLGVYSVKGSVNAAES